MARASSKKRSSAKYDVVIKAKATTTRIVDITTTETVRVESNNKGQVAGKYYSGVHWDTVEATTIADGSATLIIRFLHITNKGESVMGIGDGTQKIPNQKGIAQVTAEGTVLTSSSGLSHLNGIKWMVSGEVNTLKETVEVRGNFTPTSNP
jgi:hypothetical protein